MEYDPEPPDAVAVRLALCPLSIVCPGTESVRVGFTVRVGEAVDVSVVGVESVTFRSKL